MKTRVLLTGAAGRIGSMFREATTDRYAFRCLDRRPCPGVPDAVVADLTDLGALEHAAQGCDVMVHLGAHPNRHHDYAGVIVPSNVVGAHHAFEAAARAGIRRVVFASTVQVEFGHPEGSRVSVDMPARPTNNYASSKLFGEHLGFLYARDRGLSVICIRFGAVVITARREEMIANGEVPNDLSLTERDAIGIVTAAIEAGDVPYAVVPGYSRNAAKVKDLEPLRRHLGYEPAEDAFEVYKRPEPARQDDPQAWIARAEQAEAEALARARAGSPDVFLAAAAGDLDLARRLLDDDPARANAESGPDSPFGAGFRPLHLAASRGHVEVLRVLLERGADPGAMAREGATPLHAAAWRGRVECIRALAAAGARLDAPDPEYQATARDWAEYAGQGLAARVLMELEKAGPVRRAAAAPTRILLTGARTPAGAAFLRAAAGRDVVACDDPEPASLAGAAAGCGALVHCAGASEDAGFDRLLQEDVVGTWHALEAARLAGVSRVVLASTTAVQGGWPAGTPVTEQTPLRPANLHAAVKALNESLAPAHARRHGYTAVSVRIGGPGAPGALLLGALEAAPGGPAVYPNSL